MNKHTAIAGLGASALAFIALSSQAPSDSQLFFKEVSDYEPMTGDDHQFIKFVAKYNKSYGTKEEYNFRANQFKQNLAKIAQHNSLNGTSQVGVNHLTDMTPAELKMLNGYKPELKSKMLMAAREAPLLPEDDLAKEMNWVTKGAVTKVKNQGQCGSCWAFSTTGSVEGAEFVATGDLKSFSEQQLVDCAGGSWGNNGCNGGLMDFAFKYVEQNPLETEDNYPYKAFDDKCKFDEKKGVGKVKSFVDVQHTPKQMKAALMKGPVSVAIEADQTVFQFYTSGVITGSACGQQLDHGVLAVGYGTEDGEDYFLVKNSWGPSWGADGYVKIGAGKENVCGILSSASYPTE